jgi:phosphohistidine phosphatase
MNLWMMRHGEAGTALPSGDDDYLRPLTEKGVKHLKRQAETLKRWEIHFDCIVSSPLTRAHQTAEIIADAYKLKVIREPLLASMVFTHANLGIILGRYADQKNILITGHEPDFSIVLSQTVGGGAFNFAKGALAQVRISQIDSPVGVLHAFIPPEKME